MPAFSTIGFSPRLGRYPVSRASPRWGYLKDRLHGPYAEATSPALDHQRTSEAEVKMLICASCTVLPWYRHSKPSKWRSWYEGRQERRMKAEKFCGPCLLPTTAGGLLSQLTWTRLDHRRMVIGRFKAYFHKWRLTPCAGCDCGAESQTAEYIRSIGVQTKEMVCWCWMMPKRNR